jgi:hypothetical protein
MTVFQKEFTHNGQRNLIVATVRFDDQCKNGHSSFSITAVLYELRDDGLVGVIASGCLHDGVREHLPELAPYLKWHLCSTEGPMHYVANTVYHAGDRDHHGLRKGEVKQLRDGQTHLPAWILDDVPFEKKHVDSLDKPAPITLEYRPWCRVGEGKDRDLAAARSCAIWPDATDEELIAPGLEERLQARLPGLLAEFRAAMESLGFEYA